MSRILEALTTLAILVAAGAVWLHARPVGADDASLPADVVAVAGLPPFRPAPEARATPERREAWIERVAALGRAAKGTRRGAELLYAAGSEVLAGGGDTERARRLFLEAHQGAAEDDPITALAALEVLRTALAQGSFESARMAGAWLERWERERAPVDADAPTAARHALLRRELATGFQVDAATLLEGLARFAGAAKRLEDVAEAHPDGLATPLADLWERAARDRFLAASPVEAAKDLRRALACDPTPEQQARLVFWNLHLKHGLLSKEGRIEPTGTWPGAAYAADLDEALRDLSGNPHVGAYLLSAASSALLARADADGLALYLRALDDPALRVRAMSERDVAQGLLPAVPTAVRLGRYDEAERILAELVRLAGGDLPGAAEERVHLKLAREAAARRTAGGDAPPAPPGPPPPRPPAELLVPAPASEARAERHDAPPRDDDGSTGRAAWVLGALAAAGLLSLLLVRRLRARRPG